MISKNKDMENTHTFNVLLCVHMCVYVQIQDVDTSIKYIKTTYLHGRLHEHLKTQPGQGQQHK